MEAVDYNLVSENSVFVIRQKAVFIAHALTLALKHMNMWTWQQCCKKAVEDLNAVGMLYATHPETIRKWHSEFRKRGNRFRNPLQHLDNRVPRLFQHFPDAKESFCQYADTNLDELSSELMLEYVHETLAPQLLKAVSYTHLTLPTILLV